MLLNLPVWNALSLSKLVSRHKPLSLLLPHFCHITNSATSNSRFTFAKTSDSFEWCWDSVWPHFHSHGGLAHSPAGYSLQRGDFTSAFPVLPITVSWSLFLVPTHSGSELRSFRNAAAIAALQDEAQLTLNSYIHTRWLLFALKMSLRMLFPWWMCE